MKLYLLLKKLCFMNARLSHHKCSAYAHTYILLTSQYLSNPIIAVTYEPRREKMGLRTVQTAKLQVSLRIRAVSPEALLFAFTGSKP